MKLCGNCGSADIVEYKQVELRGQQWLIYDDGYRFWCKPAEGNPLVDRGAHVMMEYKHFDAPADDLAKLMFASLPANGGAPR